MKANEQLMIGDLVTFKDCQNDKHPIVVKIWQINADGDAFVSIDGSDALDEISIDDEVVGIPLTPEILEKNRFGKNGNYGMCDEYYDLTIRNWGSGIWVLRYECTEMPTPAEQMSCAFVHEFQHFLRHCEIDKEIKL